LVPISQLQPARPGDVLVAHNCKYLGKLEGTTSINVSLLNSAQLLGHPNHSPVLSLFFRGVRFTLRRRRTKRVWAFSQQHLQSVQEILNSFGTTRVKPDEAVVTKGDKTFCKIPGDSKENAKKINAFLNSSALEDSKTIIVFGIPFTRRLSGSNSVWVFKKEALPFVIQIAKQIIAHSLPTKIPIETRGKIKPRKKASTPPTSIERLLPIQSGEIAATNTDRMFSSMYGTAAPNVKKIKGIIGDPNKATRITIVQEGVVFTLRRNASQRIWTFKEKDKLAVEKILSSLPLKSAQENEIAIISKGSLFSNILGSTEKNARRLNELIEDSNSVTKTTRIFRGVEFTLRESRGHRVWVFSVSDFSAVEKILGVIPLDTVQADEIAVSNSDKTFAKYPTTTEVYVKGLLELLSSTPNSSDVTKEVDGIVFTLRLSGHAKIWTYKKADFDKAQNLLFDKKIIPLQFIQPGEIAISQRDPNFMSIQGITLINTQNLNDLLGNPMASKQEEKQLHGATFAIRRKNNWRVWAFAKEALSKVEKILGVIPTENLASNEFAISRNDKYFKKMPGATEAYSQQLHSLLGNPSRSETVTTEIEGIVFYLRKKTNRKVWAAKKEDFFKLQSLMTSLGIVNPNSFFSWNNKIGLGNSNINQNDKLIRFDSSEERTISLLLRSYGFTTSFLPGKTIQIRATKGSRHKYDFVINIGPQQIILEHHPSFFEERREQSLIEKQYLRLLVRLEKRREVDREALDELLCLYDNPQEFSGNGIVKRLLGRQLNPTDRDLYDIKRLILMELNPDFHDHRYLRTNRVADLFDLLIWPYFYQPQGLLPYDQARKAFLSVKSHTEEVAQEHDQIVLPVLFGEKAA